MRRVRALGKLIPIFLLLVLGRPAAGQAPTEIPAKLRLITHWHSAGPDHAVELWAGVVFQLEPGWHIYWTNPGDSGEPPKIQWTVPENFHPGAIHWPTPIRLGHGSIVDYGYEGQVVLLSRIHGPPWRDVMRMKEVPVTADVKYVVCREICIPAKAHLTAAVPTGTNSSRGGADSLELIRKTQADLPKAVSAALRVSAEARGDQIFLSAAGAQGVRGATFFPEQANQVENSAPQPFAQTKDGFQLTLKKSELLTTRPDKLKGVLKFEGGSAYWIDAPIEWK